MFYSAFVFKLEVALHLEVEEGQALSVWFWLSLNLLPPLLQVRNMYRLTQRKCVIHFALNVSSITLLSLSLCVFMR